MSGADTIFALSSGRLPAGVAVVRLSGPRCRFALETIFGHVPPPRKAAFGRMRGESGDLLDRGIALFFPAPESFTGEDCAELHIHGGRAVVSALLRELQLLPGLRHAEAGEFTKRAFFNGKIDLTAAEALADLIGAETEAQRKLALENSDGAQRRLYESWRGRLIRARAMIEAELDFADEGDIPGSVSDRIWSDMDSLRREIAGHVAGFARAEIIRDGFRVVLIGAPNSGKSSLLNALARRDAAIVSDEPGTTRDPVEVALDLDGQKVIVTDTAGIRTGAGAVESIGIERALQRARQAHLLLYLEDMSDPLFVTAETDVSTLAIGSKADLAIAGPSNYDLVVSVVDGTGLEELMALLARRAQEAGAATDTMPTRLRQVRHLEQCGRLIETAAAEKQRLELAAEDLRRAGDSLARVTGAIDVEDLLDAIFSEFCVGK